MMQDVFPDIDMLIPQRPPFMMVDKLVDVSPTMAQTTFVIKEDNMLVDGNSFTVAGMIENMAQTCAAYVGYWAYRSNEDIRIGYIGAIQEMQSDYLPKVGDELNTKIEIIQKVFDIILAQATICVIDKVITAKIKLALK